MPRVAVKICGLSTYETTAAALRLGATHIGYNFFPRSPRYVTVDQVRALNHQLGLNDATRSRGLLVGVMVDPDDELIERIALPCELDVLQLHGAESPERVAHIARMTGIKVWKVVSVKTRPDLDRALDYRGAAHGILYDAKTPSGAALPGGMGVRFDWGLLDGFRHPLPWALSGGLTTDNVADAVQRTGATLVDVSSGVESAPGVKDVDKIAAFLQAVARS